MIERKQEHCTNDDVAYLNNKFGESSTPSQTNNENTLKDNNDVIEPKIAGHHDNNVYGPRYQPVHLALPRLAMNKVSQLLIFPRNVKRV